MSEYQCSTCGRVYSFREYNHLKKVQAVKDEADPTGPNGHGYHKVCECGHEFWRDDWQEITEVESKGREFRVSTTHLVLNHGHGGTDYWYETCVFWDGGSYVLDRYETQEQAADGHEDTVRAIREGEFEVQDNQIGTITLTDR